MIVKASAAVGKSTIARHLSAALGAPLLDLSRVPVGTSSLRGLIATLPINIGQFHNASVPIIVDALDEGRLVSGTGGFDAFLETAAELLAEDRSVTSRPKLILLGRYESTDVARIAMEGEGLRCVSLTVCLFDKEPAHALIRAYGDVAADADSAWHRNPQPVNDLIATYFSAIESALRLSDQGLWQSPDGRAFAGYAPVLKAVGELLAKVTNFQAFSMDLQSAGSLHAWGVIERILEVILEREQQKLLSAMRQTAGDVPADIYAPSEQLKLLIQLISGQPLSVPHHPSMGESAR